jgi:hypothetical protein
MKINGKILSIACLPAALALPGLHGCTTEAWYKAANQSSEHHCRKQPPGESQRCLDELNKKPYAEYEKERSGQKP